jgi:ABC-type spermidine/putrescine transport system permease subunit I
MVFIPTIGSYVIPQMLGGTECVLIGNKIFMRAMQNRNIPHASALATLMAFAVLIPIGCAMWWRRRQEVRDKKRLDLRTAHLMTGGEAS